MDGETLFERNREGIFGAFAPTGSDASEALERCLIWMKWRPGNPLLVHVALRETLELTFLKDLLSKAGVTAATNRQLSSNFTSISGDVLSIWPSHLRLMELLDGGLPLRHCVLSDELTGSKIWADGIGAFDIEQGAYVDVPVISDPVVREAFLSLTIKVSHTNDLVGTYDRDLVVSALLLLRDGGYELRGDEILPWAIRHGWSGKEIIELEKIVEVVSRGGRPRIKGYLPFSGETLALWREKTEILR